MDSNHIFLKDRDHSFANAEHIFFELASEQRLLIISKLNIQKNKLSQLAKDLNITMQEVHRNVNRLMDSGLIEKDSDGKFSLTTFGATIIKQISTFDFLSRNKEYFSDHILGNIPMKFVQRIGALNNSDYIQGVVAVFERWKQIYNGSSQYIYGMLPQVPLDLIETVISKIKDDGIKFRYILSEKAIVPKGRTSLLNDSGFNELLRKGLVERRMVNKLEIAVVLNESQATVMFPSLKGKMADMNSMFYSSNDQLFHEWCLDYFRYCWYNSKSFDESKLVEV